ncbi:MAG: hypothetical protein IT168_17070 [Bryobacterales bacterium]|nr:hypothetical protein [Bryobacterales bacterium]
MADRIADAPREAFRPEFVLPPELATLPAESPVAPVLDAPPEEEPELKLAVLPPDELLPPDEAADPPPVVARVEVENERLSRPYPLRLPRNCGVSKAAALAAEVDPVKRIVRRRTPPRTT